MLYYCRGIDFQTIGHLAKRPERIPKRIARLISLDPGAAIVLPTNMIRVTLGHIFELSEETTEEGRS